MKFIALVSCCLFASGGSLCAATYHTVKVSELDFGAEAEGVRKALANPPFSTYGNSAVHVRCLQECYAASPRREGGNRAASNQGGVVLVFRLETDEPVKGFIDLRANVLSGWEPKLKPFPFTFTPGPETASTKERFEEIRSLHSGWLAMGHLPGTAWFRHLSRSSETAPDSWNRRGGDLSESFAIFSGGRAVSENLALDRDLILAADEDGKTVPLAEIKGITVPAIEWKSRLPEGEVAVDALSLAIPEDQHALFAGSLPELLKLIDRAETELVPSAQAYSVRSPFRQLASRYRKQMGLDLPDVTARLLPAKSVAITGGDPFFPLGTDVAMLMESNTPDLLYKALLKVIAAKASEAGAAGTEREGLEHTSFQTTDRTFSSHVWRMGDVVGVSNSATQVRRLMEVAEKKEGALGATDEYKFFRNRYPLGEKETAFVFLSDATIRRWAGPELRIAASRRTRAVAALGEMTSQKLSGEKISDEYEPLLGTGTWKDGRMVSEVYGSLDFITPASELGIESATTPEKTAYERWRNGYENGWAQAFDPIAIRILNSGDSISLDLSVMPLTVDSSFSDLIRLCGQAELSDKARWVPEESVLHAGIAFDTKSQEFRRYDRQIVEFLPGLDVNPLGWMTGSVTLDLGKSLFWEATSDGDFDRLAQTPVVMRIGSNSRLKLALFMTAIKVAVGTSAPDAVKWETRKSDGESYVAITGNEEDLGAGFSLYYATTSSALIVSLREDLLLRAIRREKHKLTDEETESLPAPTQLMLDSSPRFLAGLEGLFDSADPVRRLQEESWKALPILNEWHRMFPEKDPVELQVLHYGEDVFCPGGKGYRWNPEAMTMESVAFGFPASPRAEPADMPGIMDFENVRTSLEFQDDGLRATLGLGETPGRLATPEKDKVEPVVLATAAELTPTKKGMTLSYVGRSLGAPVSMKTKVVEVASVEGRTVFDVETEWVEEEAEPYLDTNRYVLDGGLFLESTKSVDGETRFKEPDLELPEKLIAGAVIDWKSSGTSDWKNEDGEKVTEEFRKRYEIRVIGKEDLKLPAGDFDGCVGVEVVYESLDGVFFTSSKYRLWYHPGTGMVKMEYLDGEDTLLELKEVSSSGPEE